MKHDDREPSLPLSVEDFRRALHAGRGRAKMHLAEHGACGMEDVILDAALSCKVYDPQCEGLPAAWFADFCEAASLVSTVLCSSPGTDQWDSAWRFALIGQFMLRGHVGAREALYASLLETESGELFGAEELVELEGAAGLIFVARRMGQMIARNPDLKADSGPLEEFDSSNGEGAALAILSALGQSDPEVSAYLERLSRAVEIVEPARRPKPTLDSTIREIQDATRSLRGLAYRARLFSVDDLAPVRALAFSSSDPFVLENSLRLLSGCKTLPLDLSFAPFLHHPSPEVRLLAGRILGQHQDGTVGDLGRKLLATELRVALELLRRNAAPPDVDLILQKLVPIADVHDQHEVIAGVLEVIEESSTLGDPRLALYAVEYSPCSICRRSAIQALLNWGECPQWVAHEAQHDAFEGVRELVAG